MRLSRSTRHLTLYTNRFATQPGKLIIFGICWVYLISITCANVAYLLWSHPSGMDTDFYLAFGALVTVCVVTIPIFALLFRKRHLFDDWYFPDGVGEAIFPLATEQPTALPETATLAQPEFIGTIISQGPFFRHHTRRNETPLDRAMSSLVGIGPILPLAMPINSVFPSPSAMFFAGVFGTDVTTFVRLYALSMIIVFVLLALPLLADALRQHSERRIAVTTEGLQWGKQRIPWREIRGFYCRSFLNSPWEARHPILYRVDGPRDSLVWPVLPDAAQTDRLAQLVYAFGMLPARDMTDFKRTLEEHGNDLRRLIAARRREGADVTALTTLAGQLYTPKHQQGSRG